MIKGKNMLTELKLENKIEVKSESKNSRIEIIKKKKPEKAELKFEGKP